jgi:SAM-dependent methyltransferase
MTTPPDGWFNPLAEFLGTAYLRNAFTKGTEQEVDFLVEALELRAGTRVLDAGCGPGRHALALAARGIDVLGVDLSPEFVALARASAEARGLTEQARFEVGDIRTLAYDACFDAVICLCQGGFGLLGGGPDEEDVVGRLATALRHGGRLACTAFNAAFAVRHLESGEHFDVERGVLHEHAVLRNAEGTEAPFDVWTTCYTPRELRLLAARNGLTEVTIHGVTPGRYSHDPPSLDAPEHLLLARRP